MIKLKALLIFLLLSLPSYGEGYRTYTGQYAGKYERLYNEAQNYYNLKSLYHQNKVIPTVPTSEQLHKWNDSRLPYKLTSDEFDRGIITWPEFFLIGNQPELVEIDRSMAGEMGFWDRMTVRASVRPLELRLYEYRGLLTGNERIRYRLFLEGLRSSTYYRGEE